jgi:uncharacterized protein YegJ (DUF2314 family)
MEDPVNIIVTCDECSKLMYPNRGKLDVEVGEHAKLKFVDEFGVEYMWVEVTKADKNGNKYEGNLDNEPVRVMCVKYLDKIEFRKEDIFDRVS